MQRRIMVSAVLATILAAALGTPVRGGVKVEEGFTRLDTGKDLKGWTGNTDGWSVVDGAIFLEAKKAKGDIYSETKHGKNAVIRMQFKADPGADSGVYIYGKQLQVRDYPKAGPKQYAFAAKPAGEWNDLEFEITEGVAVVKLNGQVIEKAWSIGTKDVGVGLQRESGNFAFRNVRMMEKK